eukprot:1444878-Rhodomonas_salina.8
MSTRRDIGQRLHPRKAMRRLEALHEYDTHPDMKSEKTHRCTWFKVTPSPQTSPSFVPRFSIGLPGTSTASVGTTFRVSGLNGEGVSAQPMPVPHTTHARSSMSWAPHSGLAHNRVKGEPRLNSAASTRAAITNFAA